MSFQIFIFKIISMLINFVLNLFTHTIAPKGTVLFGHIHPLSPIKKRQGDEIISRLAIPSGLVKGNALGGNLLQQLGGEKPSSFSTLYHPILHPIDPSTNVVDGRIALMH